MHRSFRAFAVALALAGTTAPSVSAQQFQPTWDSIDKRPTPEWFTDAKFGIFIHWGVYSVPAYAPVIPGKLAYAEWYWNAMVERPEEPGPNAIDAGTWEYHQQHVRRRLPLPGLRAAVPRGLFDPDHWADVFQRSGARYVVLTSKHHEGFALWPSKEASADVGPPLERRRDRPQARPAG